MATIKALPAGRFELTLNDGTVVNGHYGIWSYNRFCIKRGVKLSEINSVIGSGEDIGAICDFVLSAVEKVHYQKNDGTAFPYNDAHVCDWIDELGGLASEGVSVLLNPNGLDEEEKKSHPESL